jgi:hypothetical protein
MTDADVSKGLLVWDESDLGCGKGKLDCPLPTRGSELIYSPSCGMF